ncbi:hypothetical protein ABEG18_13180 [Alsobacter sp. KACC 23698]|uniref:Uncharacterized protein n=1 Tax=Alsobacter sp. KACC 23698 TaxID=3149229 RepID=A0AAU7J990_9HYPH
MPHTNFLSLAQLSALAPGDLVKHRADDLWFELTLLSEPRDIGGGRLLVNAIGILPGRPGVSCGFDIMAGPDGGNMPASRVRFAADLEQAAA